MPCTPDPVCTIGSTDQLYSAVPNFQTSSPTIAYANMGWVGFVFFRSNKLGANNILRVTTADLNLKQEITSPPVIDGRMDRTVYQMGPKIVEGSLAMPLIADVQTGGCPQVTDLTSAGSLLQDLWCWATARGNHGRMLYDDTRFDVRYANHAAFTFDGAICNKLSFSVAQSDMVNVNMDVIGRTRNSPTITDIPRTPVIGDFLAPARVLTWNDVTVNGMGGCSSAGTPLFYSNQVRNWSMDLNNNADRFYTFNGSLFPVDINVGKREISGSLTLMGMNHTLRLLAETNQNRFTEKNELRFAFYIGENTEYNTPGGVAFNSRDWVGTNPVGNPIFARRLVGTVFKIETIKLANELFESTVEYMALANDLENYEAISPSSSCSFPAWQ